MAQINKIEDNTSIRGIKKGDLIIINGPKRLASEFGIVVSHNRSITLYCDIRSGAIVSTSSQTVSLFTGKTTVQNEF